MRFIHLSVSLLSLSLVFPTNLIAEFAPCGYKEMDIVLMLDVTGSSDAESIFEQKRAVREVLAHFEKNEPKLRFALGQFNTSAKILYGMTSDYEAIRSRLSDIPKIGDGGTHIHTGLDASGGVLRSIIDDSRQKAVMLFSDGLSQTSSKDVESASVLKEEENALVFTVHYRHKKGNEGRDHMKEIASKPSYKHYMRIYGDLAASIIEQIRFYVCNEDPNDVLTCYEKECQVRGDLNSDAFFDDIN